MFNKIKPSLSLLEGRRGAGMAMTELLVSATNNVIGSVAENKCAGKITSWLFKKTNQQIKTMKNSNRIPCATSPLSFGKKLGLRSNTMKHKNLYSAILFFSLILNLLPPLPGNISGGEAYAGAIFSNGTGGGAFSLTATWTSTIIPGPGDTAVIVDGDVVTLTASRTLAGLRIMPSAKFDNNNWQLTLAGSTVRYILYGEHNISGHVRYDATGGSSFVMTGTSSGMGGLISGAGQFRISDCVFDTIQGIFNIPDADIIVGYDNGCGGARLYNYATITMTNGDFTVDYTHILYNYGTISMENGNIQLGSASSGATVDNDGDWLLTNGSINYIAGSGINFRNQSSGVLALQNGNIKMTSTGGDFSNNGITTIAAGYVTSNSALHRFYNNAGGTLNMGGIGTPMSASLNFRFIPSTSGANTVNYTGAGTQKIKKPVNTSGTLTSYWHLTCSNKDAKTIDGYNLTIKGDLTIRDSAILDASQNGGINNYDIAIAGNWYDSSAHADSFIERTGTVTFSGDSAQMIVADSIKKETFYNLVLNDIGTVDDDLNVVTLHDSITVLNTFTLTDGILNLDKHVLTLASKADTALIGGSDTAYIRSEDLSGYNQSRVQWNVQDTTGNYTIPFGVNENGANYYIPFTFNITTPGTENAPGSGYFSVSTYSTSITNTPLPIYPDSVTQAYDPANAVDRFWQIDAEGYSDNPAADLTFTYPDPEKPSADTLVAQHWNTSALLWDAPASAQTYTASASLSTGAVTIPSVTNFSPWTLSRKTDYLKCPEIQKSANSAICYGDTIVLSTLTTPAGFYTQTWSPATGLNSTTGYIVSASPGVGSITYTVSGNDGAGCYNNQTIRIEVNPLPTLSGTATTALCYGSATTLTISGAAAYNWIPASYLNTATANSVILSQAPVGNMTYTITGYNEYNCSSAHTLSVTVHALPIVNAGTDPYICLNDTATLIAIGTGGNYTWSPGTYFTTNTGALVTAGFPAVADTYTCSVILQDSNNCSAGDTVLIHVVAALIANAGADQSICSGSTASIEGTGGNTYTWAPQTGLSSTNTNSSAFSQTAPGAYTYYLTVSNGTGCTSQPDAITITVIAVPTVSVGADITIRPDQSDTLHAEGNAQSYSWTPNACSNCLNPVVFPSATTQYILTASNAFCTAADTVIAHYIPYPCDIYIPNAFSPNNDGQNDSVRVNGHCILPHGFAFRIFNRWGTKVFESFHLDQAWDGKYENQWIEPEVFVFSLNATTINNEAISLKGNISLIR